MSTDEYTPRADTLHPLAVAHHVIGSQEGRQGAGQTLPEDLLLCVSCGWMRTSQDLDHLSDLFAARDAEVAERIAQAIRAERDACPTGIVPTYVATRMNALNDAARIAKDGVAL